ncbi:Uncharacterised protein [Clostridium baratii]|uniref:DUF4007 family protein n=1 Tax=Clostridium baratii TaxID=1561 RepID=UPI0006C6252A|nr:DUF4007 family protein [Clostridium baratii]CUP17321.1 Uncharacterised protein [Clostridium baratii]
MAILSKRDIRIKGHGSFYLREGWITKGLRAVNEDENIFSREDAADILGVGKNMVPAIKYWLNTLELIRSSYGENRKTIYRLSDLGKLIFNNDLYLEERFTLWILHYKLVRNFKLATSWYILFNRFDVKEFTKDELFTFLNLEYTKLIGSENISLKSLNDDAICLLRTYYSEDNDLDPEETLKCPLSELKILKKKKDRLGREVYVRQKVDRSKLDPLSILYVIKENSDNGKTTIEKLVEDEKNIGKVFNLERNEINEYLDDLQKKGYVEINRTAGLDAVYIKTEDNIIKKYYGEE